MRIAVADSGRQRNKNPRPTSRSFRVDEVGRGCATNHSDSNREPGFFVIAVEKLFSFRTDWHQDDRAHPLVRQYQSALDSVLESHPELRGCAVACVHCGIRFLTHPRNAGRENLRCPFGCRRRHRQQCSSQRSTAYYRTASGKRKKNRLNGRRSRRFPTATGAECGQPPHGQVPPAEAADQPLPGDLSSAVELPLEGVVLDESSVVHSPVLPYLAMVLSLLEGRPFRRHQVVTLLRQALRQHRIANRSRREYVLRFLHQHPP